MPDTPSILDEFRAGRPVIVVDDETRENEGDLVVAASFATPEVINFMGAEARGLVCIAMTGADLDRLNLPLMVPQANNVSRFGSPFTISVDARRGISTGISAYDRARTVEVLVNPDSSSEDLSSPGHVFPLRAHDYGLEVRRGHTEAGVDLARAAGLFPAAVICEIMSPDGTMARGDQLTAFAARHGLQIVSIEELSTYPVEREHNSGVRRLHQAQLPTRYGTFRVQAFRDREGSEHVALTMGAPGDRALVRLHSECLTGDVLGSLRCDCGDQLQASIARIATEGSGVILYLRQEGRGIGLANKVRAYALQDEGMDTVEANHGIGFSADLRDYRVAASILQELGIGSVRLLTNNPDKVAGLDRYGIEVIERLPLRTPARPENQHYLNTKAAKLNHILPDTVEQGLAERVKRNEGVSQ